MKAVIQRVKQASVTVQGETVGQIDQGLLVLLGVANNDTQEDMEWLLTKIINLRIFSNEQGKFDKSLLDIKGEILVVSQFTLFADCRKGRRPSFEESADPDFANKRYLESIEYLKNKGLHVASGKFAAMMDVHLVNDGPVTIAIDSKSKS